MFLYVDVCLTDDVLDLIDPWPEFSVSEYGTGLVCRDQGHDGSEEAWRHERKPLLLTAGIE